MLAVDWGICVYAHYMNQICYSFIHSFIHSALGRASNRSCEVSCEEKDIKKENSRLREHSSWVVAEGGAETTCVYQGIYVYAHYMNQMCFYQLSYSSYHGLFKNCLNKHTDHHCSTQANRWLLTHVSNNYMYVVRITCVNSMFMLLKESDMCVVSRFCASRMTNGMIAAR